MLKFPARRLLVFAAAAWPFAAQPAETLTALERGFRAPPPAARPHTLWMWMNGNVTADGITRDLEAMAHVGLGGALIFNVGEFIPKGPVDYGSPQWRALVQHAAREAGRLGLELGMHNCPGWSSSGGPWITPEKSMQQLVWTETRLVVDQAGLQRVALPQPFTNLGFYRDAAVIAFPSLPGETRPFADQIVSVQKAGAPVDKKLVTDRDPRTGVAASAAEPLVLEFAAPFEARAASVLYRAGGSALSVAIEAGDDGVAWRRVAQLAPPGPRAIDEAPLADSFAPVRAKFFRIVPSRPREILEVELHAATRIPGWPTKAGFMHRPAADSGAPPALAPEFALDPASVRDLTAQMDAHGRLACELPAGAWTILRFGHTARGQENIAAPDSGRGLECDKLTPAGAEFHFQHGLAPLLDALGSLTGRTLTTLEIDSYEVGMQNWSATFRADFVQRNGYDLLRYLPAMTGRYVGDAATTERFLWDLRRTLAELVADNYYGRMRTLAAARGVKLMVEPYGAGPGPYDEIEVAGRASVPMGEFWARTPWDDTPSVKLAASAAHTHGEPLVAAESFTAEPEQSRWLEHPYALKTIGDYAFSLGLNAMFFHRFAHQPHPDAAPGMTMGPWGIHFDRTNTWFEQSGPWLEYLARCQFLLRQGRPIAGVLYFTGEGSPQMSKRRTPELPTGYDFDAVDTETLLTARVEDGRIALPGGTSYRLLALPPDLQSMTPPVLKKLRDLVAAGAALAGPKPTWIPTLRVKPTDEIEFRRIADEIWDGKHERVFAGGPLADVLRRLGVPPDFASLENATHAAAPLAWAHRRIGDADIYFVANRQRHSVEAACTFGVAGKRPELWRPDSGEICPTLSDAIPAPADAAAGTHIGLRLDPAESVFVVFRPFDGAAPLRNLAFNGGRFFPSVDRLEPQHPSRTAPAPAPPAGNFTVTAWIKPDTYLRTMPRESLDGNFDESGKSYVVPPPTPDAIPPGGAAAGIAAGRNGVFVFERSADRSPAVLVSNTPIAGWTHLAVVYRDGKPSLYLNGRLAREGLASGRVVQPALGLPSPPRKLVNYFDGDLTRPELFREALSAERVAALAARGLPPPDEPVAAELVRGATARPAALIWQPGSYALDNAGAIDARDVAPPATLRGPWTVNFPANRGAPPSVSLPELASLSEHADPGVRYFAGTANYTRTFEVAAAELGGDRRLVLDLGRVEVVAEVRVNGRAVGTLWRPPFRVDITAAAHAGANDLEVRVTTLWVNRLIGDEALPAENRYNARTHAIEALPEWYRAGAPKPAGGRTTFTTWRHFTGDEPLVPAGLLGPVRLLHPVRREFK